MTKGIKFKFFLILGAFVAIIGGAIGDTIYTVQSQSQDGKIINIAAKQRMLTQKMSKESFALSLALPNARENLTESAKEFDTNLKALEYGGEITSATGEVINIPSSSDRKIVEQLEKVEAIWDAYYDKVKIMLNPETPLDEFTASSNFINFTNMTLLTEMDKAVGLFELSITEKMENLQFFLFIFLSFTIVLAMIGWVILTRVIVTPLTGVVSLAESVARGDLDTEDMNINSDDEMGQVGEALNQMKSNLNSIISQLSRSSENVATASTELATTAGVIVRGANNQSAMTDQVATSMEEMSATVIEVARNSHIAAETAREAQDTAVNGGEVVNRAVEGMLALSTTFKDSALTVEALGDSSDQIGAIVAVINDIADQTNLLALNAAIEAARAGEQGRGFAVVADEVRKLAEKTTKATKEIGTMIQTIQADTKGAISSMHEGTKHVDEGVQLANDAGVALGQIVTSVDNVTDLIRQIATAAEEQSATTDEISASVNHITGIARETAVGINEISTSSEGLSFIADELKVIVSKFHTDREVEERGDSSETALATPETDIDIKR